MLANIDYVGLGALVSAVGATIVSIIVAVRQTNTHAQISAVQDAVKLSNGHTIGEAVEQINANTPTLPTVGPPTSGVA